MTGTDGAPPQSLPKVAIVGRDVAAWLTACVLQQALGGRHAAITVVALPSLLGDADVAVGRPALRELHNRLGFDEWALLARTQGCLSLGQNVARFAQGPSAFFQPYGDHGRPFGGARFLDHWLRARAGGMATEFEAFSLNAVAARALKVFKPNAATEAFQASGYGCHLDARGYAATLRQRAEALGVAVVETGSLAYRQDAVSGDIRALLVEDGGVVDADWVIDASGEDGFLLREAMAARREDWSAHYPFHRFVTLSLERRTALPAYAEVRAIDGAVGHLHALRGRTALVFGYHADHMDEAEAARTAAIFGEIAGEAEPGFADRAFGVRPFWRGNVIGIGAAAAVLDPLNAPDLHLVHEGIVRLLQHWPAAGRDVAACREAYHQAMVGVAEQLRDAQLAHYHLNRRHDTPLWRAAAGAAGTPRLRDIVAGFAEDGRLDTGADDPMWPGEWQALLIGHGVIPRRRNPAADAVPAATAIAEMRAMLAFIAEQVAAMPSVDALVDDL